MPVQCPKCGRRFSDGRGVTNHINSCGGKAVKGKKRRSKLAELQVQYDELKARYDGLKRDLFDRIIAEVQTYG